ncbi:tetratricopeptide repeat protein 28-like [Orbicella faveolata]|uniref:tetratricopeptide repeat protein 28-like n=1 Tax=Orbicella faveolata TaxID=48498 RepID=UPI0009E1BFD5|nr:tetratricopeptide repeat protein 28-like [Orbicella faveolata]XP_020627209.1 tetratricopeptide repeat protein 28-like [Orbicella faveolata]
MNNAGEVIAVISIGLLVASFLLNTSRYITAIELCKECLFILKDRAAITADKLSKSFYKGIYFTMWKACSLISDNTNAIKYAEKLLQIYHENGERLEECELSLKLAVMYCHQGKYPEAIQLSEKALLISREIGDRKREADCHVNLGAVYQSVGEYKQAKGHLEKSLSIHKEITLRNADASSYLNLGAVCRSVGEYEQAIEHLEKSLAIYKVIGDRNGEAASYANLGNVYQSFGEYEKAREHLEKSLVISKQIRYRIGEAASYFNLGSVYESVGNYEKASKHLEKSLVIYKEIGSRKEEANCYGRLGQVYRSVGEYEKAREHLEKSLAISKEIGIRKGEAASYGSLGMVYRSVGEYEKARENLEKSLVILKEIGDKEGEVRGYITLGNVYASVGEYEKSSAFWQKSLAISKKIGNRFTLAVSYQALGVKFFFLGKYNKANEYNQKALIIFTDIGHREGTARSYLFQGVVEQAVGNFVKAKEYFEKALAISKEIGNGDIKTGGYLELGGLLVELAEYDKGEEYIKKALELSEAVGDIDGQFLSLETMAYLRLKEGEIQEAILYFLSAIEKSEQVRGSLRDNDQFKISFSDRNIRSYRDLSALLCETGNPTEALYVSELSNARALADLMSAQYSVENQIPANPRTWAGIEGILGKEFNRTCLYVSYHFESIYLWILKEGRVTHFREMKGNDLIAHKGLGQQVEEFFDFRSFGVLPEEICEDRSLHGFQPESKSREQVSHKGWRLGKESEANQGPKMNLPICYKLIIAPLVNFLEGPEIIIVPDRALYQIPFAALTDESGKYLSESFRIRIVPSLRTLKLLNESPADYHCQTGALIVGNPDVGEVHFRGKLTNISRLQCAENEAKRIAKKLGVEPLLGQQATKKAVLQAMNSVALIHIAAHGDAERGAIALAPSFRIPNGIPQEGLYLLTMSDISKVQLRAKLVVLSCCHSARGQTKAEGAVGIARAFLGSGARSVLVALWALDDKSTAQLMTHFYDHLVAGKSAGESLHEAMKWMRSGGCDVNQWAPFILIGDDVTFDFGKKGVGKNDQDGSEGSPEMYNIP